METLDLSQYSKFEECPFKIESSIFNKNKSVIRSYDYRDLNDVVKIRKINPEGLSLEELCREINKYLPSFDWEREQLKYVSSLPDNYKRYINDYQGYGYSYINSALRINPDSDDILIEIIDKAPSIPNNIFVFRQIQDPEVYIPKEGIYESLGMLSTTFDSKLILESFCHDKDSRNGLMRIFVPKGTKGLYLPGYESEILLNHKTKLLVKSVQIEKYICPRKYQNKPIDILVYDIEVINKI